MRLLLTGAPGIGKTTLIRAVVERLEPIACAGFYTEEKRHRGQRIGFKIVTLEGEEGMLATLDGGKPPTVGKYTVHVEEFERLALPQIETDAARTDLYVIDEIGRMELLSQKFRRRLIELMARPSSLLATIALKGKGFIEQLKGRNDFELIRVTRENRDQLPQTIAEAFFKTPKTI